jgi:transposase
MQTVTTIGLDIAKSVFQVHGVDAAGQVVIRRRLKRWFGAVAVGNGHHHWPHGWSKSRSSSNRVTP